MNNRYSMLLLLGLAYLTIGCAERRSLHELQHDGDWYHTSLGTETDRLQRLLDVNDGSSQDEIVKIIASLSEQAAMEDITEEVWLEFEYLCNAALTVWSTEPANPSERVASIDRIIQFRDSHIPLFDDR